MPYDSAIIELTCSGVVPGGRLSTPAITASSAEPMAADMVCEPARMPPAAPGGRPNSLAPTTTMKRPMTQLTTASSVNLQPVAAQAVHEGWADPQADAVHEQVVEHRLGEVIELQLHAVGGGPHRKTAADDDGRRDHAETVARR